MIESKSARDKKKQQEIEQETLRAQIKAELQKEQQGDITYSSATASQGYIYVTSGATWSYKP